MLLNAGLASVYIMMGNFRSLLVFKDESKRLGLDCSLQLVKSLRLT